MFNVWLKHFIYENCIDIAFNNVIQNFMSVDALSFNEVTMFITHDRRWLKFNNVVLRQEVGRSHSKFVSISYQSCEVRDLVGDWYYEGGAGSFPLTIHDIHTNVFIEPMGIKHTLERVYEG